MQNDAPSPTDLPHPGACRDMAQLRAAIDTLDARLVRLLALRQGYVERAAVLKTDRGTIRDESRIEAVMERVMAEAKAAGLSLGLAEALWRVLLERSIAHEFAVFDARR